MKRYQYHHERSSRITVYNANSNATAPPLGQILEVEHPETGAPGLAVDGCRDFFHTKDEAADFLLRHNLPASEKPN